VAYVTSYGNHPITEKLNQQVSALFPTARSVTADTAISGVTEVQLVSTGQNSWAETNLKDLQDQSKSITFDQGQDKQGPIPLAVAAENINNKGRIVVFGDSDFATDQAINYYNNQDLLVNSVDWATQQENQINLTPKNATQRLVAPPSPTFVNLILLGTVFILPGLMLVSGVTVFFQRRRRG
jgi:ABC-type uncharacterized transport system involved in gliding motility auxiliary subunit